MLPNPGRLTETTTAVASWGRRVGNAVFKPVPDLPGGVRVVDAVFVDVDNTLYDFESSMQGSLKLTHARFEKELGVPFPRFEAAYWAAVWSVSDAEALIHRGLDHWRRACLAGTLRRLRLPDDGLLAPLVAALNGHRLEGLKAFPGTREALDAISETRTLGVITNGPAYLQREKLRLMGLQDTVDDGLVLVSGELPWSKPAPGIFLEAARRAGAAPDRCVMVGDSPDHDMPAAAVGFRTVWANPKGFPVPPMEHPPTAQIGTPAELPLVLEDWEKAQR